MMLDVILAFVPILVILVLMVGYRWGASRAGAAGYLAALAIAVARFGAGAQLLAVAHVKALLLTFDVLFVIWMAFLLFRVADEAGAITLIGQALPHLTADKGMLALMIGWAFASFLQGVGGFGVPVAVIAPLMVGLEFTPLSAVVIPSIGHSWAVTFGSLGSSFNAMMAATGLDWPVLAPYSALFLGLSGLAVGLMVAHAAAGFAAVRRLIWPILILGVVMGGVLYLAASLGLWNIASFLGGLAGLLVSYPLARRYRGEQRDGAQVDGRRLLVALSGYAVLVMLILLIQLTPAVRAALGVVRINLEFPAVQTARGYATPAGSGRVIPLFRHAGAILLYASLVAYFIYARAGWYRPGAARRILEGTVRRVMSSSVGIASMVAMAVVMQHAGMTETLARGLAEGVGAAFPLVAPWIGALGAFMTGSNTNSNVVFSMLQLRTAELLGYSIAIIMAAQNAGAALGSVVAPTKIVVGASTGGMAGREGDVMRQMLVYTGLLVLLVSAMAALAIWL
ncbi:MAG: L-lactate permease [Anaerolineae bacterium]|nr:MAG: L-lactate permease [Anaerolineae bacterium]